MRRHVRMGTRSDYVKESPLFHGEAGHVHPLRVPPLNGDPFIRSFIRNLFSRALLTQVCEVASRKLFASFLVVLAASAVAFTQDASAPAAQSSSPPEKSESSSHRSVHHVRVPDEDSPAQPAELTAAEAAIDKKNYAAAEAMLRKFVEHDPSSYVGWFDLGFVENALGKVDESIAAYRKSVAAKPDVFEANLNLGLQLAKTGQPEAEKYLRAATLLKPTGHAAEGQYRAWMALGQAIQRSKPDEALAAYQKAGSLQPKEPEPHLFAGPLYEKDGKYGEAEREYKQALAVDPASTDAAIGLANIYMRGRRFSEAEDYLRKLLEGHTDSGPVHIQLGRVLAAEGKTDAAIAELQTGIKLAPDENAARRDLADLYLTTGKNDLAEAAYRELLLAHPNDAEVHRNLGETFLKEKKFPEAQKEFTAAVRLKPDLGIAYGGLAFAAGENKDYSLAIRALDARAKLLPETPVTYFMRASAFDHLKDFKKAAANYRLFLENAKGKYPDQEWQAQHRLIAIEPKK
jgi:tetratricopeptide (TPR) repeat protein